MSNHTKNGLLLFIIGTILAIVENVISFLTNGSFSFTISGLIFLIGIILMFVGRKEFSERHRKFVVFAVIFFILSIIITVIFVIIIAASAFSSISMASADNIDLSWFKNIFLIAPIVGIIGGISNILLVHELEDDKGKMILYASFIITVILSFYILFAGMALTEDWITEAEDLISGDEYSSSELTELTENLQQELTSAGVFSIIGNGLFLIAYYIAYNRIKTGKLVPNLPSHLKRCRNCGRVNSSDSIVCAYCGNKFNESQYYDYNRSEQRY